MDVKFKIISHATSHIFLAKLETHEYGSWCPLLHVFKMPVKLRIASTRYDSQCEFVFNFAHWEAKFRNFRSSDFHRHRKQVKPSRLDGELPKGVGIASAAWIKADFISLGLRMVTRDTSESLVLVSLVT